MLLSQIAKELSLKKISGPECEEFVDGGVYVSDLLSLVIANARYGAIWITHQGHPNIVALASLLQLSCVIVGGGITCQEETVRKATEENIRLFTSELPIYQLAGRLYALGLAADNNAELD